MDGLVEAVPLAAEKTNMRKAHANARNGPGDNYKRHDKQQVIDCKQQEREWRKEDGKKDIGCS